jgi:tRNA (mo5U34)-methyltransferase
MPTPTASPRKERFDYVLLLGLLYHLKYLDLVLDRAAEMMRERIYDVPAVIGPEIEAAERKANYERSGVHGLLLDPGFPKLALIEELYNNDPTNGWLPNHAALPAMMRSAGLRVIARPHSHVLVAGAVSRQSSL